MVHSSTSKRLNGYYLVSARTLTLAASWAQSGKEIRLPACHRPKISWGPRKSTGMATAASPACSILTWDLYSCVARAGKQEIDMGKWNMTFFFMSVLGCDDWCSQKGSGESSVSWGGMVACGIVSIRLDFDSFTYLSLTGTSGGSTSVLTKMSLSQNQSS